MARSSRTHRPKKQPERSSPSGPASREQLLQINSDLVQENERLRHEAELLRNQIGQLRLQNEQIRRQLQEAQQAACRQAAPFRRSPARRKPPDQKKRPGRRAGHPGSCRPRPSIIDRHLVSPRLRSCPDCGGQLESVRPIEQFIEDIPPSRPEVTRLVTWSGQCRKCGRVSTRHPLQVSLASGSAGVHLGPRALGLALDLVYRQGLTRRRACQVLKGMTGLSLTPGGLSQAADRMGSRLEEDYEGLIGELRCSQAVYSDETSWWVEGKSAWLWVFTNEGQTVYRVAEGRGRNVVHEMVGEDFPGVLVSDCLASYDEATPHQHKCYAHHQKAIGEALEAERLGGRGRTQLLEKIRSALRAAMVLKEVRGEMDEQSWVEMRLKLEKNMDRLLEEGQGCPATAKVAQRLLRQRDHLFVFLDHPEVEATNNRAERQLRPAVIARKLSAGNRSRQGARTWEVLASLGATCVQRDESFVKLIARHARPAPTPSTTR